MPVSGLIEIYTNDFIVEIHPNETILDISNNILITSYSESDTMIINDVPTGTINGINTTFTTTYNFVPESVSITLNGLEQRVILHYATYGNNLIIFTESPQIGDLIQVDYIKLI